eukprot:9471042-Ditylum_brightwellii.AAC.1
MKEDNDECKRIASQLVNSQKNLSYIIHKLAICSSAYDKNGPQKKTSSAADLSKKHPMFRTPDDIFEFCGGCTSSQPMK